MLAHEEPKQVNALRSGMGEEKFSEQTTLPPLQATAHSRAGHIPHHSMEGYPPRLCYEWGPWSWAAQ